MYSMGNTGMHTTFLLRKLMGQDNLRDLDIQKELKKIWDLD